MKRLRASNIPLPEAHLAGLLVGLVLHRITPLRLLPGRRVRLALGSMLCGAGLLIGCSAVVAAGETEVAAPARLVTTGPYRFSRNPMYLAWTLIHASAAVLLNSLWIMLTLVGAIAATHRVIHREEQVLEARFGNAYRRYREQVRRYL